MGFYISTKKWPPLIDVSFIQCNGSKLVKRQTGNTNKWTYHMKTPVRMKLHFTF